MNFPTMSADLSLEPTTQKYNVKVHNAKVAEKITPTSDSSIMPSATKFAMKTLTVGMGKALFVKTGQEYLIQSGQLTLCSFAGIRCLNKGNIAGNLFVHHGFNDKSELESEIHQLLKQNELDVNSSYVELELQAVQTAWSTTHNVDEEQLELAFDRNTEEELRSILSEFKVKGIVKSYTAKQEGTNVEVDQFGYTKFSEPEKFCVIL